MYIHFDLTVNFAVEVQAAVRVMHDFLGYMPSEVCVLPGTTTLKEINVVFGRPREIYNIRVVERMDLDIEPGYFAINAVLGYMLQHEIYGEFLTTVRATLRAIYYCLGFVPTEVYVLTGETNVRSFNLSVDSPSGRVNYIIRVIERDEGIYPNHLMFVDPYERYN